MLLFSGDVTLSISFSQKKKVQFTGHKAEFRFGTATTKKRQSLLKLWVSVVVIGRITLAGSSLVLKENDCLRCKVGAS